MPHLSPAVRKKQRNCDVALFHEICHNLSHDSVQKFFQKEIVLPFFFPGEFPQGLCIFVAGLIHYFYLVAFAWMLFEGVYLYLMVVKVFNTEIKMRLFYAVAWGKYLTDLNLMKFCYGSIENRNNRQVMSYVTRASAIEDRMLWNLAFLLFCLFLYCIKIVSFYFATPASHSLRKQPTFFDAIRLVSTRNDMQRAQKFHIIDTSLPRSG